MRTATVFSILMLIVGWREAYSQHRWIPHAGITFSQLTLAPSAGEDIRLAPGFTAGAGCEIRLLDSLFIQPEINFLQKGVAFKSGGRLALYYFEIPVLAKVKIGAEHTKFYVAAGPSIAIGIGGKYRKQSEVYDVEFSHDKSDPFEKLYVSERFDFCLQLGGGLELQNKMVFDIRYSFGLTELFKKGNDPNEIWSAYSMQAKTRVLQVTVGLPLKAK